MAFKMKGFPMIGGTKPMKMAVKSAMKMKAEKAMKLKEESAMKLKEKAAMKKADKPDFIDIDGDNNTTESMKKAAADKKSGDSPDKMKKDSSMKLKSAMKDDRSLIRKAGDEVKQIGAGIKSFIEGNPSRTRYGSSTLSQEIRDFKKGYKAEEDKQKKERTGKGPKTMKKDAAMKLKENPMKMKKGEAMKLKEEKAAMKMGHSPKKMGHKK